MSRRPRTIIECRDYVLPPDFPVLALSGEDWRISDVRAPVLHFHNSLEIGVCHSDSGILEFQDTKCRFKAGDVTLIASGMPHTTYSSPGTASHWSYLFLDLVRMAGLMTGNVSVPEVYRGFQHNSRLVIGLDQDPILAPLVTEIVKEMADQGTHYKFCVGALLDALLCKLSRHIVQDPPTYTNTSFPIAPALQYIDLHYMDDFKVDDLAALCKMSTSNFRRVFTDTMGKGPLAHLNQTRIMRACTLLQVTDRSIVGICEAVGFLSLSSFNRHFSALMGQTPTAWRRAVHTDQQYTIRRYPGYLVPPKI